jgi:hypothetical protein
VPVHEIGEDEDGLPYFTMKRLAGRTMHEGPQRDLARRAWHLEQMLPA